MVRSKSVSSSRPLTRETVKRSGYAPWLPGLDPAERRARLRAMRAFVYAETKADHPVLEALERAEREESEEALVAAFIAFNDLSAALREAVTEHLARMTALAERRLN